MGLVGRSVAAGTILEPICHPAHVGAAGWETSFCIGAWLRAAATAIS